MKTKHFLLLGSLLLAAPAHAASTLMLYPTADSFIRSTAATTNNGTTGNILIGDTTTTNDFLRGVFAFDLSDPLLTGQTITGATLTLTISAVSGTNQNATVTLDLR